MFYFTVKLTESYLKKLAGLEIIAVEGDLAHCFGYCAAQRQDNWQFFVDNLINISCSFIQSEYKFPHKLSIVWLLVKTSRECY
jgi:hypothetical protein